MLIVNALSIVYKCMIVGQPNIFESSEHLIGKKWDVSSMSCISRGNRHVFVRAIYTVASRSSVLQLYIL